jgi:hypothetical protein
LTFVLVIWLLVTVACAGVLLVVMGLQRLLLGPAQGPRRRRVPLARPGSRRPAQDRTTRVA